MLGAVLVDQPADRAAGGVIDAGDTAGADGDEFLLGGNGQGRQGGGERGGGGKRSGLEEVAHEEGS